LLDFPARKSTLAKEKTDSFPQEKRI